MLESLRLDPQGDFITYPWLGNTGSVALPITMAIGLERGFVRTGDNLALLGIGSGINSVMLGVRWQKAPTGSQLQHHGRHELAAPAVNVTVNA
jgi:3-oxoacyl-[acyl-carrier-protein] synthase-3